jgi:anti-sigma-K factor RskA
VKGWVGYALLAISLVIAFQGFSNVRSEETTVALARSVACDVDSRCVLKSEDPEETRTDVFGRKYQWRSSVGPVHAVCRRQLIFFGAWHCHSVAGEL